MSQNTMYGSQTEILYFIITRRYELNNYLIETPRELSDEDLFYFLRSCPKNLWQIGHALDLFESILKLDETYPLRLNFIYPENLELLTRTIKNNLQVKVFCIDYNIDRLDQIIEKLSKLKNLSLFFIYNTPPEKSIQKNNELVVKNHDELIALLKKNKSSIIKNIPILNESVFVKSSIPPKEYGHHSFSPSQVNYWILNQINANHWYYFHKKDINLETELKSQVTESSTALSVKNSYERQELLLSQVEEIDFYTKVSIIEKLVKPLKPNNPILPSLVLTLPYHNPQLLKIHLQGSLEGQRNKIRQLFNVLETEQTSNYILDISSERFLKIVDDDGKKEFNVANGIIKLIQDRTRILDHFGFLHASFQNNPVYRFPLVGKSINRELSFFKPQAFINLNTQKSRRKIKTTISILGKKIVRRKISPKALDYIQNRNGQIIAISDLPIEWIDIKGIPLCFTHDICRIPETPLRGVMSHFTSALNQRIMIDENIYSKILVVFGSSEDSFIKWQNEVVELKDKYGFNTIRPKTINELEEGIKRINPTILIFDCHGAVDPSNYSTHLLIHNEKLTNEEIVNRGLHAPIVFFSACGTSPNYGFFNAIIQGFFETGSISITSTFLPIGIETGSALYLRLLNKLKPAIELDMHKNWLEFVSHIIRSSSITQSYLYSRKKGIPQKDASTFIYKALTDILFFERRREVFYNMDKEIEKLNPKLKKAFSSRVPEYLFYTNLGRPDLIYFQNWLEKKKALNLDS